MENLTISLPEALRRQIDAKATARGFGTASDYVRDLIERDVRNDERLKSLLREGMASNDSVVADDAWWERKFAEYDRRFGEPT